MMYIFIDAWMPRSEKNPVKKTNFDNFVSWTRINDCCINNSIRIKLKGLQMMCYNKEELIPYLRELYEYLKTRYYYDSKNIFKISTSVHGIQPLEIITEFDFEV